MAESMSTPGRLQRRFLQEIQFAGSDVFSGSSQESRYMLRYMLRIFSKAGLSRDQYSKVYKTCGIKISEDDTRSSVLCRSGVTFVDKMDQFIRGAQFVNNTPSDLNSEYSVKRCVQLSPSSRQPSKRLSKDIPPESFDVDEQ